MSNLLIGAGSIVGRDHRIEGKNSQDAYRIINSGGRLAAVVCDGCGDPSAYKSEVGANFGADLICKIAFDLSRKVLPEHEAQVLASPEFWERVALDTLAHLRTAALVLGDSLEEVIITRFLFTTIGALVTPNSAVFFSLGDGNIFVNGERTAIGPFEDNIPPYLAYRLINSQFSPDALRFTVNHCLPLGELSSFLVGCDGVNALIDNSQRSIPRNPNDPVGTIDQFWTDPRYLTNPAAINQRLKLIGEDYQTIDWADKKVNKRKGLLPDDTTFVVGALSKED